MSTVSVQRFPLWGWDPPTSNLAFFQPGSNALL
jgi:hypothetical protein